MAIKIYGSLQSTCTKRAILTALELGIHYDLYNIDMMKGEHKSASYITSHQPFGRVPALEDGSIRIFESRAICRYLVAKYAKDNGNTGLWLGNNEEPVTIGKREEIASVEYSYFDPSMAKLGYEKVFKKFMGKGEANTEEVETASRTLGDALDYFERVLKEQPYLSDQAFGLLDIYVAPWIEFLPTIQSEHELSSRERLRDWWTRVSERPSWKKLAGLQGAH